MNTFRKKLAVSASLFLLAGISYSQSVTRGTVTTGYDAPMRIYASGPSMMPVTCNSNGTICWSGDRDAETRKDDGRGPTLAQVKLAAHLIPQSQLAPANYITLARSIGITALAEEAELLAAIHEADLTVYDFDKVDGYLYRQALRQGANMRWVWRALREADEKTLENKWGFGNIPYRHEPYSRALPVRVLGDIKAILEKLPDAIFLVSDYEVVKPDPFLAVTTKHLAAAGKMWIVDQWDEPGFDDGRQSAVSVRASR